MPIEPHPTDPELVVMQSHKFNPQKPWVDLTDEEVQFCALKHRQLVNAYYDAAKDTNVITAAFEATVFYKEIAAALKERNHD